MALVLGFYTAASLVAVAIVALAFIPHLSAPEQLPTQVEGDEADPRHRRNIPAHWQLIASKIQCWR